MMRISEPVTMLTDYALAVAGAWFASSLMRMPHFRNASVKLWAIGFTTGGFAALVGGTYHGFALQFSPSVLRALWNITLVFIGLSGGFMVSGVLTSSISRTDESRVWLIGGVLLTVAGLAVQLTGYRSHLHFNHNDIYHVIQIGALYLFFRGAQLLQDRYSPR